MKPPFAYYGGKTTLAERIAAMLPEHRHYVEPFGGSLAVLLAKPSSKLETVNDIDGDLVHFWRVLRERPAELAALCALTPHSRAEHQAAYSLDGCDDLERARRVWVLLSQGRTGTMRRTGWRYFSNPAGTGNSMPAYLAAYADRMPPAAMRLRNVSLECRPALELVADYGTSAEACLYVDCPYFGDRAKGYRHEMTAESEHRDLGGALHECAASVVLSGYDSPLYTEMYGDWHRVEISAFTGQGAPGEGERIEVLWSNRDLVNDGRLFGGDGGHGFESGVA